MTMALPDLLALCVLCLIPVAAWKAPSFCHETNCPEYTVIHTYPDFEERLYRPSHWLTVDVSKVDMEEVKTAMFTLYYYTKGENKDKADVKLPWPSTIQVEEEGEGDEQQKQKHGSVSWPIPSGTHLPKANAHAIKETHLPAVRVYVRSFGGVASEKSGTEEVTKLRASVKAMGMTFVPNRFVAAGYDSPLNLINRHNEVWVFAE
ncbi:heme-binding protein soul2 [Engraulis encrasicolus]|uniref:heme-binding protein soul2 n=1 Tax=Engraulis encrasicolus TaxID=184585 RepID=UPI002FD6E272